MKKLLLTFLGGVLCSLVAMGADVTFGLTQAIDTENKKLGAVSYTGTTNVTNSGDKRGSEVNVYAATGSGKTVYINDVAYVTDSHWRKSVKTSAYSANQWAGYELTVAKGYKLNITGVHAMLSIADDTYTWKVSILDASDQVLYESQSKTTKKASTTDFKLDYASLPEATKAKLTGITGTIKVRVYMYQGGTTKYFAIPYLTVTGNVEESNTPSYEVTATAAPEAGGTVSGDGSWEEGKNVSLTATPNKGYKFVKWTIDESETSTDNPYVISTIAAAHSAVATFEALPKITYTLGEGAGVAPAVDYAEVGANVTLPSAQTQLIYKEGYTMTGWTDGANTYAIGAQVPVTGDMTFTAVFEENQAAIGDAETTVDWNFKTGEGAPAGAFEGNVGYYAKKATINGKSVDVIMKINTETSAAFPEIRGKWNTSADANRAQINKGTILTIPAISGMEVTMTITNGTAAADMFKFNGEQGEANESAKTVSYTYNGAASTIDIIDQGKNAYPAGLSVVYPAAQTGEDSDLAVERATIDVQKDKTYRVNFSTSSTGAVTATSSKESVATAVVDGNNIVITGVAAGTATITVSQASDATYKAGEKTITVTVTDPTAPVASFTAKATAKGNIAVGAEDASIVSYATIKGGSMTVFNGQTSAIDLVTTGGFSITNNNTYFKVTLNKPLMAGDKISTDVTEHKDTKGLGLWFTTTQGRPSTAPASATSVTTGTDSNQKITENLTYTVAEEDGICGETTFYVYRAAGKTTYFQNFTITTAATIAEATLNAKGYSTFSAAYPVKISGAKAYKATINAEGDKLVCTEIENGLVPAGEGVLLFGEAGAAVTASYDASAPAVSDNSLKATTLADGSLAAKVDALVLSGNTFLPYNGAAFAANKAYLPMPAGAKGGFSIVFDEDNTTAAAGVAEAKAEVKTVKLMTKDGLLIKNANGIVNAAGAQVK